MDSERMSGGFDLGAVGHGLLWGMAVLLVGGLLQGIVDQVKPLAPDLLHALPYVIQGVGSLMAGLIAARRAGGGGLVHGLMSGLVLMLTISLVHGILTEFPALAAFAKNGAVALASGAIGGILGVNFGERM